MFCTTRVLSLSLLPPDILYVKIGAGPALSTVPLYPLSVLGSEDVLPAPGLPVYLGFKVHHFRATLYCSKNFFRGITIREFSKFY